MSNKAPEQQAKGRERKRAVSILSVSPLLLAKTNAGSATVFCDEINSGLFEGVPYIFKRTLVRLSCASLEVCNGLCGSFACLC